MLKKKKEASLIAILMVVFLLPFNFANTQNENINNSIVENISNKNLLDESDMKVLNEIKGHKVRLLQLQKRIELQIDSANLIIDKIENESLINGSQSLKEIVEEFYVLVGLIEEYDLDQEKEIVVKDFVDMKKQAIELTFKFREEVKNLLSEQDKNQLKKQIEEKHKEALRERNQKLEELKRKNNFNKLNNYAVELGISIDKYEEDFLNGNLDYSNLSKKIKEQYNSLTLEEREEIKQQIKAKIIRDEIDAKQIRDKVVKEIRENKKLKENLGEKAKEMLIEKAKEKRVNEIKEQIKKKELELNNNNNMSLEEIKKKEEYLEMLEKRQKYLELQKQKEKELRDKKEKYLESQKQKEKQLKDKKEKYLESQKQKEKQLKDKKENLELEYGIISEEFLKNLENCIPDVEKFVHPFTNEEMNREIIGLKDDLCHYVEDMPNGGKMICEYDEDMRVAIAKNFKDTYLVESVESTHDIDLSNNQTTHTYMINGEEVENPSQTALEKGICKVTGY